MAPKLTFYPLGNADSCLIELADDRVLVFDFAAKRGDDPFDPRIDLAKALREDLGDRTAVDVLAISHLDEDHYKGTSDVFYLEHAAKYQDTSRIHVTELWVPAAVIVETAPDVDEAKVLQAEARHRLREGKGIRVFSRPRALEAWFSEQGLELEDRAHLITDAGQLVPGFELSSGGVEIFVHSPFAQTVDGKTIVRNSACLAFHLTFDVDGRKTRAFFAADLAHEDLEGIVNVTKAHGNEDRLELDVAKLSHHCSYLAIGPDKGTTKTAPIPEVKWLYEDQGQTGLILVSSSAIIPTEDTNDPPHRQAARYYEEVVENLLGEFAVTMEHPKKTAPERLVIEIGGGGASWKKKAIVGAPIVSRPAPRAG